MWVCRTVEKPYDPRDFVCVWLQIRQIQIVETFAVDLQRDQISHESPSKKTVVQPEHLFQMGTNLDIINKATDVPEKISLVPTTPNTTTTPETNTKPTPPKRQNPLFVGPIEDDIPLDDPYFNHNGNVSSFMETYTNLHNNLTASKSKRVVVYFPMKETGLGNSLLALSSSFFYAILTKRAFLLNYAQFTRHFTFSFKEQNSTYTCMF